MLRKCLFLNCCPGTVENILYSVIRGGTARTRRLLVLLYNSLFEIATKIFMESLTSNENLVLLIHRLFS